MFKNIFRVNSSSDQKSKRRLGLRSRSSVANAYQSLEQRRLLAGIFHDAATGTVTISGGSGDDSGRFFQLDATTYRATLAGEGGSNFDVSEVDQLVFIGYAGDDFFNNLTSVSSRLLGNSGNDILRGGSGDDIINGGNGNDNLFGNEGGDRILGLAGNDRITGGDGSDQIFAGNGTNLVRGGEGDDLIFGGTGIDTIFGDSGIDQIFGLAGNDRLYAGDGGVAGSAGTEQADLILGHEGDDEFFGAGGLNVFYGGNGDDIFIGGDGENRIHGQNGNDQITGGAVADYLAGHLGDDTINGLGGNDFILPSLGNDIVDGGSGTDKVVFLSSSSRYIRTGSGTSFNFSNLDDQVDGDDVLDNVESVQFTNGVFGLEATAAQRVTVQPIIVSNSNGTNTAEFFGNGTEEAIIKADVDSIFEVADIDIQWLPAQTWNSSIANIGTDQQRPRSDLFDVVSRGDRNLVGSGDSLVIDMYFVEVAPGFGDTSDYAANGLAYVGSNGIAMHTGDFLPGDAQGRSIVARVAAHEIAHNLGLAHSSGNEVIENLMEDGRELSPSQISTMLASPFTVNTSGTAAASSRIAENRGATGSVSASLV